MGIVQGNFMNRSSGANRTKQDKARVSSVITPGNSFSPCLVPTSSHKDTDLDNILKFLDYNSWRCVSLTSTKWSKLFNCRGSHISIDAILHLFGKDYSQRLTVSQENKSDSLVSLRSSTTREWTEACDFLLGYMHSNIAIGSSTSTSMALRLMSDFLFHVQNEGTSADTCSKQMEKLCANPYLLSFTCIAISLKIEEGLYTGGRDTIPFPSDNSAYSFHRKFPALTKRNVLDSEKLIMKALSMTLPICHFAQFARPLHYRISALHNQEWKENLLRPPTSPLSIRSETLSLVSKHAIFRFIQHALGRHIDYSEEGRALHPSVRALCVTILSLSVNHIINLRSKESHENKANQQLIQKTKMLQNQKEKTLNRLKKDGGQIYDVEGMTPIAVITSTSILSAASLPSTSKSFIPSSVQSPLRSRLVSPPSQLTAIAEQKIKEKQVLPALESLNLGIRSDCPPRANAIIRVNTKNDLQLNSVLLEQNEGPKQKKRRNFESGKEGRENNEKCEIGDEKKGKTAEEKMDFGSEEKEKKKILKNIKEKCSYQVKDSIYSCKAEFGKEIIAALLYEDLKERESVETNDRQLPSDPQTPRRAAHALEMTLHALLTSHQNLCRLQKHVTFHPSPPFTISSTPTFPFSHSSSSSSSSSSLLPPTIPLSSLSYPSSSILPLTSSSSSSSFSLSSSTSSSSSFSLSSTPSDIPILNIQVEKQNKAPKRKTEREGNVSEIDRLLVETFRIIFNVDSTSNSGTEGRELVSLLCKINSIDISHMKAQIFETLNDSFNRYRCSDSSTHSTSSSLFPKYPVSSTNFIQSSSSNNRTRSSKSFIPISTTIKNGMPARAQRNRGRPRKCRERGSTSISNRENACSLQNINSKIKGNEKFTEREVSNRNSARLEGCKLEL